MTKTGKILLGVFGSFAFIGAILIALNKMGLLKKATGYSLREVANILLSPAQEYYIQQLNPQVQDEFRALIKEIQRRGYTVILTSAFRTKSKTSMHGYGLAVDLNLQKGTTWWRMATPKADWEATGIPQLIRDWGFRWGGDFVSTGYDPVHVDLGKDYTKDYLQDQLAIQYNGDINYGNKLILG